LRLAALLLALVVVNIYVFFFRGGTSLRDVLKAQQVHAQLADAADVPDRTPSSEDQDARHIEGTVAAGETLGTALARVGVASYDAEAIARAQSGIWDARVVTAGQSFLVGYDAEGQLRSFEYHAGPALTYRALRTRSGALRAWREDHPVEVKRVAVGGAVGDSLFAAVVARGEGRELGQLLADTLAPALDVITEASPDDRWKVVVEKRYTAGRLLGYGRILAYEYAGRAGTWRGFYAPFGAGYYDDEGQAQARSLVRSPLRPYAPMAVAPAAPAGAVALVDRRHLAPVARGAAGSDFAAPVGTAVWATATGTVTQIGGAGSMVMVTLSHGGGLETRYGHLLRLARGLRVGQSIRQMQVIGYVGRGADAGAAMSYVRYGVFSRGQLAAAVKVRVGREAGLPPRVLAAYRALVGPLARELERVETPRWAASEPR
jgi:murein DD-endopeptidase MepM/ murein hydrolase activator NlpD